MGLFLLWLFIGLKMQYIKLIDYLLTKDLK